MVQGLRGHPVGEKVRGGHAAHYGGWGGRGRRGRILGAHRWARGPPWTLQTLEREGAAEPQSGPHLGTCIPPPAQVTPSTPRAAPHGQHTRACACMSPPTHTPCIRTHTQPPPHWARGTGPQQPLGQLLRPPLTGFPSGPATPRSPGRPCRGRVSGRAVPTPPTVPALHTLVQAPLVSPRAPAGLTGRPPWPLCPGSPGSPLVPGVPCRGVAR